MLFVDVPTGLPQFRGGKLRAIRIASPERSARLPDVPTFTRSGVPNFPGVTGWMAVYGPTGIAAPVADCLTLEIKKIVLSEDFVDRARGIGNETAYMAPAEMKPWLAEDLDMWKRTIKELNLTPEK